MMIVLEVIRARSKVDEIADQLLLVEKKLESAEAQASESMALQREGLSSLSACLQTKAELDQARALVMLLQYQQQVAVATLMNIIG